MAGSRWTVRSVALFGSYAATSLSFGCTVPLALNGLPQEEVLQHELPLPPCKRSTAGSARYLAIVCLRPGFDFDHLIEGIAVRAREWIECGWPATSHDTPPNTQFLLANCQGTTARAFMQLSLCCHTPRSCSLWSEALLSYTRTLRPRNHDGALLFGQSAHASR